VWFIDARTVDAVSRLIQRFDIPGIGVWNIMYYYAQLWMVLNSQYMIKKIYPEI
jgi:spore germination protein